MKLAECTIYGIKCDHCDYRDDSVQFEDYPLWLNRPCPKCGANLLTQADFDAVVHLLKTCEEINSNHVLHFLNLLFGSNGRKRWHLNMNGSGTIDPIPIDDDEEGHNGI